MSVAPTKIVVKLSAREIYSFDGAFAFSGLLGSTNGTINSFTVDDASHHLIYSFTHLSLSFATYLSYATVENSLDFEQTVLGGNGAVIGGAGDDYFIGIPGVGYDGGAGSGDPDGQGRRTGFDRDRRP